MEITLPYPPSVNRYWRSIGRGRVIISREGRSYRREVGYIVVDRHDGELPEPTEARLKVTIKAFMPDRRRRDLDNVLKATLDSLQNGGIFKDDEQIDDLRIIRSGIEPPGRLEIAIEEHENE
jgi:crossover junction endodeoxyribonuclease RusA